MKELLYGLKMKTKISIFPIMKMLIDKFSNPVWLLKIVFLTMGGLAVHIKFLSSFMGR